jgi:hypothetical protein
MFLLSEAFARFYINLACNKLITVQMDIEEDK